VEGHRRLPVPFHDLSYDIPVLTVAAPDIFKEIIQKLLSNSSMKLFRGPLYGFRDVEKRLSSFLPVIRILVLLVRNIWPQEINSSFQVLSALIEQVNICWILDICTRYGCIHD
jgi:hypothetical protein